MKCATSTLQRVSAETFEDESVVTLFRHECGKLKLDWCDFLKPSENCTACFPACTPLQSRKVRVYKLKLAMVPLVEVNTLSLLVPIINMVVFLAVQLTAQ